MIRLITSLTVLLAYTPCAITLAHAPIHPTIPNKEQQFTLLGIIVLIQPCRTSGNASKVERVSLASPNHFFVCRQSDRSSRFCSHLTIFVIHIACVGVCFRDCCFGLLASLWLIAIIPALWMTRNHRLLLAILLLLPRRRLLLPRCRRLQKHRQSLPPLIAPVPAVAKG